MRRGHADYLRKKAQRCCQLAAGCPTDVATKLLAMALDMEAMAVAMELEAPGRFRVRDRQDDGQVREDGLARAIARYLEPRARKEPHLFTVLFVEDDSAVRHVVVQMLTEKGFGVLSAPDAEAAVRVLVERPADLLFADIAMPGMDGVELARRAKILRPAIKVLFATGYPQQATEREALRHGKLLFKPLRRDELLREVEVALSA